jgi:hypothetical protein
LGKAKQYSKDMGHSAGIASKAFVAGFYGWRMVGLVTALRVIGGALTALLIKPWIAVRTNQDSAAQVPRPRRPQ